MKKIKIGLLVDSLKQPIWVYEMLDRVVREGYGEITLVVKNELKKENKSLLKRLIDGRNNLFFIFYNRIDKKIFKPTRNPFKTVDIQKLVEKTDFLNVIPKKTKWTDTFINKDVNEIEKRKIDVLVRLGFRILKGDILKASKFGIWSYHHGDNKVNRGGPAGVWEVLNNVGETGAILQILTPKLDNGKILSRTYSLTDEIGLLKNQANLYWNALSLLPRKIKELSEKTSNPDFNIIDLLEQKTDLNLYTERLYSTPKNTEFLKLISVKWFRFINQKINKLFNKEQWRILYNLNSSPNSSFSIHNFKELVPPKDRFWADPHALGIDSTLYIFIEEWIYKKNKGTINVLKISNSGELLSNSIILEKDYHLSYPFIFKDGNDLFMIPETKEAKNIQLLKCVDFPLKWEFETILKNDVEAVDSTIFKHNNKYWLFANIKENYGASSLEELHIFHSDKLKTSNWVAHKANPVISDVKSARPAGRFFKRNGKVYRPSQINEYRYGYGININEVLKLDENEYLEKKVSEILPNWNNKVKATHSFSFDENVLVIDGLF